MSATPAIINVMTRAAEAASKSLLRDFGEVENLQVSQKGPSDFVSAADLRAEKILYEELKRARPNYDFVMEESGKKKHESGSNDEGYVFHVDPLDGTNNFIHGIPHWAISIGLEQKGEIVAGVIYDPVKDELFWAAKGAGAFMRHRRLRVSSRKEMHLSLFATGTPAFNNGDHEQFWSEAGPLMKQTLGIRRMGSAALDLAYVAAGRLDGYWEHTLGSWDVAAGVIIVKEAGGYVSTLDKGETVFSGKSIVASTPLIHKDFLGLLQKHAKAA
jgi:myo-inositol-1(or 4)-monophosphatase